MGAYFKFLPTQYGNCGNLFWEKSPVPCISSEIVVKYAYTPFGYSGVMQNLPLFSSRSPFPTKVLSSTKNPRGKLGLLPISTLSYPEVSCLIDPPEAEE